MAAKQTEMTDKQAQLIANAVMTRAELMAGLLENNKRDLNRECQYPDNPTFKDYYDLFVREGVANRAIRIICEESWQVDPHVYETEDQTETQFEMMLNKIVEHRNLWHYLERLDVISGIGQFAVMLIGIDDGQQLDVPAYTINSKGEVQEADRQHEITYLRVYSQKVTKVSKYVEDPTNPRFGLPEFYAIDLTAVDDESKRDSFTPENYASPKEIQTENAEGTKVHWTRVIHFCDTDNCVDSEIFALPRAEPNINRLLDIRKILGGSAESHWKGGFPGFSIETKDKDGGAVIDSAAIRQQVEGMMHTLRRYMTLDGATVNTLDSQIADPEPHFKVQVMALAMQIGCPYRKLLGTEEAKLAGAQDTIDWNRRLQRRQAKILSPRLIRETVNRFMALGVLPTVETYFVDWEDLFAPSDKEKADVAEVMTKLMAMYVTSELSTLIPPLEFFTVVVGWDQATAQAVLDAAYDQLADEDKLLDHDHNHDEDEADEDEEESSDEDEDEEA